MISIQEETSLQNKIDRQNYTNLATLLHHLQLFTPRVNETIPKQMFDYVRTMCEAWVKEYPKTDLQQQCFPLIAEGVSSCVDKAGLALIQVACQIKIHNAKANCDEKAIASCQAELDHINHIATFIADVDSCLIDYDKKNKCFISAQSIIPEPFTLSGLEEKVYINQVDEKTRRQKLYSLPNAKENYKLFTIGDHVEDILLLINQLKEHNISTLEPIDMMFAACATLRIYIIAALRYLYPQHTLALQLK